MNAKREPTDEECDWPSDEEDDDKDDEAKLAVSLFYTKFSFKSSYTLLQSLIDGYETCSYIKSRVGEHSRL